MNKMFIRCVALFSVVLTGYVVKSSPLAVDVFRKRFDAPRIYFTSATLNKGGAVSAVQGQDNALRLFITAVEEDGQAFSDQLTYTVDLPEGVEMLFDDQIYPHLKPVTFDESIDSNGMKRMRVTGHIDPQIFTSRCVANTYGVDLTLWFRADPFPVGSGGPITVTLAHNGQTVFTDRARLHVYEELVAPPPVHPEHFTFHLHQGPDYRQGRWDELSNYLRRAGINAIMMRPTQTNALHAMQDRGFFTIAQRGGGYRGMRSAEGLEKVLEMGQAWFEQDDRGVMADAMPYSDAVLWDFEPVPRRIVTNATTLARFRNVVGLPSSAPLTETIIEDQYLTEWIDFRQDMFAEAVRYWAAWSRSLKPDVKTLLTEGRVNVFDPSGQIDYRKYYQNVTNCSPMNWNRLNAVEGMRQWKAAAPNARFAGCMNVAGKSVAPVTVPANTIMLQIASTAFMGNSGIEIYPGQTMDGENFVAMNRVMGFLGRNQSLIWKGQVAPPELRLIPLPKEDFEVVLGSGKVIRNRYPDWERETVQQTYQQADGEGYLAALVNWNVIEPCYTRIQALGLTGQWMLVDREHRNVYTVDGKRALDPSVLEAGCIVQTPPSDFRGFHLVRYNPKEVAGFTALDLTALKGDYENYALPQEADLEAGEGGIRLGYDDIDEDNRLEYKISTRAQTVWISQTGQIVRWQAGGATINTDGFGLSRDQFWLPESERGNTACDSLMALEKRTVHADRTELVLARTIPLESLGGMVDVRLTRRYLIEDAQPGISVNVELHNTSLSAEHPSAIISYRVHNHLRYDTATQVWIDDGKQLLNFGPARHLSIPNTGLTTSESERVYPGLYGEPMRLARFGEYAREKKQMPDILT